jgi:hypothetical protein
MRKMFHGMQEREAGAGERAGAREKVRARKGEGARVRVIGAEEGASQKRKYKHWCSCT